MKTITQPAVITPSIIRLALFAAPVLILLLYAWLGSEVK